MEEGDTSGLASLFMCLALVSSSCFHSRSKEIVKSFVNVMCATEKSKKPKSQLNEPRLGLLFDFKVSTSG
jgi:hypothetical protein